MKQFKDLKIIGPDAKLVALIDAVSTSLPGDWHRDPDAEARMEKLYRAGKDAGFSFTRDANNTDQKIGLFLARERGWLNVPNIVPLDSGELTISQYNRILEEFATIIRKQMPQDGSLRIQLTSDEAAISDWVSSEAADLLANFSELANMSTGAGHPHDFRRWARFLIQVHKEGSTLHSSFLSQWLVE
ncbi:MAG: hypothetical protein OXI59_17480, partial [Gemmatimonadota bacterium]|nr:hypothetical protein [Gemmatimonadota bacterium]